ncbi:MAG: carbohydrate porin [Rhodobacteraceae bacterium]|nr:carbohydrate porin [Paracoccaceae bacterium]
MTRTVLALLLLMFATALPAQEAGLSGPSSVAADFVLGDGVTDPQFRSDFPRGALPGLYAWRDGLTEKGLSFGADYLALGQWSDNDAGADRAAGGIARVFGTIGAGGPSSVTFKVENRHTYGTDIAPQNFGFENGALSITGTAFSDIGTALTNLFYTYRDPEGRFTLQAGQLDVTDFLDVYGLVSPYSSFQNLAFNTNPTINAPNQGLGLAGGVRLGQKFYAIASVADANGDPAEPDFDIFDSGETFKSLEIGVTSGPDRIYFDNIHVTFWQSDAARDGSRAGDKGATFSAAWFLDNRWMPFLRAGVSEGKAALYKRALSTGIGWYRRNTDLAGLGLNWAEADGIDGRQFTAEAFYRFSLSPSLQITPSIQLIDNPLLTDSQNRIAILGLRGRFLF